MRVYLTINHSGGAANADAVLRQHLRTAARLTLRQAGFKRDAEISLLLIDDAGIRELNCDWRGQDQPTDVLSFPLLDRETLAAEAEAEPEAEGHSLLLGDIVISRERAAAQAQAYGHSETQETVFLFVHGLLHLLGHDHELGQRQEEEMFGLQDIIMEEMDL